VLLSSAMEKSLFSAAFSPICGRSRSLPANKSVNTSGANHYPRSSTPLQSTGAKTRVVQKKSSSSVGSALQAARKKSSSSVQNAVQQQVQNRSSDTESTADKPSRKRKSRADVNDVRAKVAKQAARTKTAGENDRLQSGAVSGHSQLIKSLAGELQQQKREVMD